MRIKWGIKLLSVICICVLCIGMTMIASANTDSACRHKNAKWYGENVDYKIGTHYVTLSQSQGPQQCDYSKWVEKTSLICTDCGYVLGGDTYYHEKHSICGIDY